MKQLLNSTQIPNKLLEELYIAKSKFTGDEKDLLLYICRKTIGWQKETDGLTLNLICKETHKKKSTVSATLKSLIAKKAITKEKHNKLGGVIGLDLDTFGSEEKLAKGEPTVSPQLTDSSPTANSPVSQQLTPSYKRNYITKYTITKDLFSSKEENKYIISLINKGQSINDTYRDLFAIPAETKALRKLLEAVPQEQVEYVVNHLVEFSSNKYCPDITKPTALYKNGAKLTMFIRKEYGDRQKEDKSKLEREYTQLFLYNKRSPVQEQRFQTLKKILNK